MEKGFTVVAESMKKLVLRIAATLAVVCSAAWLFVRLPSAAPPKVLEFAMGQVFFSNGIPRSCSVVLSNTSGDPISYYGGVRGPWFDMAYLTNDVWQHCSVRTVAGGDGVTQAHEATESIVEIPDGATAVKFGLHFTSLTWRGRLAWGMVGSPVRDVLRPVAGFLLHQDEKGRSKTEWSEEYPLVDTNGISTNASTPHGIKPTDLPALLFLPSKKLELVDFATMNLLCARGLPGAEDLDVSNSLALLDHMAARVRAETDRHYYRFQKSPGEFDNSEGFFRMIMLSVVLAEDFQVHYAPDKIGTAADARADDGVFSDSQNVFLHGLTGPKRQGTCSSLPVLHVSVGRRLPPGELKRC
jgi:hypothetical protein